MEVVGRQIPDGFGVLPPAGCLHKLTSPSLSGPTWKMGIIVSTRGLL